MNGLSPQRHAVIQASAGTGKTHTLELLVVDLLQSSEVLLEQILVVTYTERAASELRSRLRQRLKSLEKAQEKIARALVTFDSASICTIHGFCQRMLLENAFVLQRPFEQCLVNTRGTFSRSFTEVIRKRIARQAPYQAYLETWLREGSLEKLEDLLFECHERRGRLVPSFCAQAYMRAANAVRVALMPPESLRAELKEARIHSGKINALLSRYETLCGLLLQTPCASGLPMLMLHLDPILEYMQTQRALLSSLPSLTELSQAINALVALPSGRSAVVQLFLPLVQHELKDSKAQAGELDFSDMLTLLAEKLEGPSGDTVAAAIQARYRYGVIDEFQDTDDVQWRIMRRLFLHSDTQRLYVIGDPKQAIYGFRGADLKTYLGAVDELIAAGGDQIVLTKNYRSSAELVHALNAILDQHRERPFFQGDIRYDHPVAPAHPPQGGPLPVHIFQLPLAENARSTTSAKAALGRRIAQEIQRLLAGCGPIQVAPSDIFILSRTSTESVEISEYLAQANVPYAFYKLEGLFQTPEARHVLDVLGGIARPEQRAACFLAWLTPFFSVPMEAIGECMETEGPLMHALLVWKELADRREFQRLFSAILEQSGIIRRELFLAPRERALTNYFHIFELLLERAEQTRVELPELIQYLSGCIQGHASPDGENANVQRLESDRAAVQLTSMHRCKGLEARVVFIYGGFEGARSDVVRSYHHSQERVISIGRISPEAEVAYARERAEEDQRLLYVALTRAKERLYIPHIRPRPKRASGLCGQLLGEVLDALNYEAGDGTGFSWEEVPVLAAEPTLPSPMEIVSWRPPPAWLKPIQGSEVYQVLRTRNAGFSISSYSSIKATTGGYQPPIAAALVSAPLDDDLPGGPKSGRFLHEILELIPLHTLREGLAFELWSARRDIQAIFHQAARNHDRELRHIPASQRLVWSALTTAIPLKTSVLTGGICTAQQVLREMEFLYATTPGQPLIKGYIDVVFEHAGQVFLLDWKTDLLPDYGADSLEVHVSHNYVLQGAIYSRAMVRTLHLTTRATYDARFGGVLFGFVRGMAQGPGGVWFRRPAWRELMESAPHAA